MEAHACVLRLWLPRPYSGHIFVAENFFPHSTKIKTFNGNSKIALKSESDSVILWKRRKRTYTCTHIHKHTAYTCDEYMRVVRDAKRRWNAAHTSAASLQKVRATRKQLVQFLIAFLSQCHRLGIKRRQIIHSILKACGKMLTFRFQVPKNLRVPVIFIKKPVWNENFGKIDASKCTL